MASPTRQMTTRGGPRPPCTRPYHGPNTATIAGFWTTPWVLGSTAVFVAVFVVMYAVAAPYYYGLREAIAGKPEKGLAPVSDAELASRLVSRRPEILAAAGGAALAILVP